MMLRPAEESRLVTLHRLHLLGASILPHIYDKVITADFAGLESLLRPSHLPQS